MTASAGTIADWTITSNAIYSSPNTGSGMEINTSKGIIATNEASHSIQSHGAQFNFVAAHISIDPNFGGMDINPDGTIETMGGGGGNYDEGDSSN